MTKKSDGRVPGWVNRQAALVMFDIGGIVAGVLLALYAVVTRWERLVAYRPDEMYPFCDCGRPREISTIGRATSGGGLFGGPFHRQCAFCEARGQVERVIEFTAKIHPEWDDEEWLDHLSRVFPETFDLGVMPDYWYELRYPGITRTAPTGPEPESVDPLARRPRRDR